jgi:hypothetical protein
MAGDCAHSRDRGFFAIGWLTRIALTLAIVGVIAIDGISLALGHMRITDAAGQAASAAMDAYGPKQDTSAALVAAQQAARDNDTTVSNLLIANGNVSVTVHGTISTFVVGHLPGTTDIVAPSASVTLKIVLS